MSISLGKVKAEERVIVSVWQEHHISQAQRAAKELADAIGMSQAAVYSVATAVSELACNIFFHAAGRGMIIIRPVKSNGRVGIEVLAEDSGPGIADIELAIRDGFSTNGGLGGGLPGVKRLMDEFEIESSPGRGTLIVVRKWETAR